MRVFAETQRLILREILPDDVDGFFEMDSDPEVHTYLGNKPVTDKSALIGIIDFIRQQYVENGIGRWAMLTKDHHQFIGWAGLKLVKELTNNHINYYDLGYRLGKKYWGKGYATEAALASLKYGFEVMHLQNIYAAAHRNNNASNRILQKTGFSFVETFHYDNEVNNWYRKDSNS